jgi:hypothetical protein
MAAGTLVFRPPTRSVKNNPIERGIPVLAKVTRIPEAAPRWRAGTEFIIEDVLGEANSPPDIPETNITAPKGQ